MNFAAVLRVAQDGRVEGDGVAAAVGQQVEVLLPVALAVRGLAAQHLADRVDIGGRAVDVRAVGGADGVGEELALGAPVRAGGQDVGVGDPVVPAQHARAELAAGARWSCASRSLPSRAPSPACAMCVGLVVVPAVFGGLVQRHGLQHLMPHPVVLQRLDQFAHGADLLVEDQVLDRQERVDRGGVGDRFDGDKAQLRAALVDVLPLSAQPFTRQER